MIPNSGNIKDYNFSKLLISLNKERKTGTLKISTPNITKILYLDKGSTIFASSSDEDERLGEVLVKAGKITIEQYKKSVELLKETGDRQGTILVRLGYLKPGDLFWGVKHQVKEIIYSLFQYEDAEYEFREGELNSNEVITLNMSTGNLIYEGVKRINNLTKISREMPDIDSVPKLGTDPACLFQDVSLSSEAKNMLKMIDNKTTMQELIDRSSAGSFESIKTLYVLYSLGIIEVRDTASEKTEVAVPLEDILKPFPKEKEVLIKIVDQLYANLDRLSARELLEVDESSDVEIIRINYYRLMKEFHPDRFLTLSDPAIEDKVMAIVEAITKAYSLLKHGDKGNEVLPAKNPEGHFPEDLLRGGNETFSHVKIFKEPEMVIEKTKGTKEEKISVGIDNADLCISQGEYEAAMDIYNDLLSKDPYNVSILQHIEELKALLTLLGKTFPDSEAQH
jgi:tetratricopeptide (TPR) repeat protein